MVVTPYDSVPLINFCYYLNNYIENNKIFLGMSLIVSKIITRCKQNGVIKK